MDLKLDEQILVNHFRNLDAERQQELLNYAARLAHNAQARAEETESQQACQCSLGKKPEARPEAAKEPIFTE